jgi:hypothetical protein
VGVPVGGTTGQVLAKTSATDYATGWVAPGGGGGMTNPMTTKGDVILGDTAGAPVRLAAGTAGQVLTAAGAGAFPAWATPAAGGGSGGGSGAALASAAYQRTSGDYTTTSTSFVDVDATNLALTIVTGARRVLISLAGQARHDIASDSMFLDVMMDGVSLTGATNGIVAGTESSASYLWNPSFTFLTDVLSAGTHVFKLRWRVDAGTGTLRGSTGAGALRFAVTEVADSVGGGSGGVLNYQQAFLAADVPMPAANTFYDGPSVVLSAGTWLLIGQLQFLDPVGGQGVLSTKLWDGTTVAANTHHPQFSVPTWLGASTLSAVVVVASGTPTWKMSAASAGTADVIKAVAGGGNLSGNLASHITAIKLDSLGGSAPVYQQALLGTNVPMPTANTYYDGPSIVLTPGTWMLSAWGTFDGSTAGASDIAMKLWDGTTVAASSGSIAAGASYMAEVALPPVIVVVPSGTATWKISAACNAASAAIRTTTQHNPAGNNATGITAVKLDSVSSGSGGGGANIQSFRTPGSFTWTKPSSGTVTRVFMLGGGGGGGSGRKGANTSTRLGGAGGGSGGYGEALLVTALLPATMPVVVGAGGAGGTAVTASDTDGVAGVAGGECTVGSPYLLWTGGGNGGGGGTNSTNAGGTGGQAVTQSGSAGGASSGTLGIAGTLSAHTSGGGGGGGATGAANPGGNGGALRRQSVGNAGGAIGAAGTSEVTVPGATGGAGAGGGGSSITGNAGAGGAGAIGSGGGGGGAAENGVGNSGAGGKGGDGWVVVVTT